MTDLWQLLAHTDNYLLDLVTQNSSLAYVVLFLIVFLESGNLLFAFLPGDGLLLAAGIIAASGALSVWVLLIILIIAAVMGYLLNYSSGQYIGLRPEGKRWIKPSHVEKTKDFFTRHGDKALIIGRFFPVIRTFAPFLAGVVSMRYEVFLRDTIVGAIIWISFFITIGYLTGDVPIIRDNFFLLYLSLVVITMIPFLLGGLRALLRRKRWKEPSEFI